MKPNDLVVIWQEHVRIFNGLYLHLDNNSQTTLHRIMYRGKAQMENL